MSTMDNSNGLPDNRTREVIDWDCDSIDYQNKISGKAPGAKYGAFSETMRHTIAERRACSMFCGGNKCKYCNPVNRWKPEQMEVKGLFSNWVTDNILAMSRPTTKAIEEHKIIDQFKESGITSVINLQLPGEHSSCGFGNEAEGFSYVPQQFMDNDIFFYNFGWQDYGIGSLTNIMDMVKVMQFALSEGKVAVHCHAGLGRTGVLIACYIVFANRLEPHEVIHYIRSKREGAIQTRSQIMCIEEFSQFLKPLQVVYCSVDDHQNDFTLTQFLIRQRYLLHGEEARKLKNVPKIVFLLCERLLELAKRGKHHAFKATFNLMKETAPKAFNNTTDSSASVKNNLDDTDNPESQRFGLPSTSSDPNLLYRDTVRESYTAVNIPRRQTQTSMSSLSDYSLLESDFDLSYHAADPHAQTVAEGMAKYVYSDEETSKVNDLKALLNNDSIEAYHQISTSTDAVVLSALLWAWLDELQEPILHPQDMPVMLECTSEPLAGLKTLEKGAVETIECVFSTICRLEPLSPQLLQDIMCRALSTLTHQNMTVGATSSPASSMMSRTSNQSGIMRANVANRLLIFFMGLLEDLKKHIHEHAVRHSKQQALIDGMQNGLKPNGAKNTGASPRPVPRSPRPKDAPSTSVGSPKPTPRKGKNMPKT